MSDDKIYFPNEVIGLKFEQGISLLAAWCNYWGLSQTDLAERFAARFCGNVASGLPVHPPAAHTTDRGSQHSARTSNRLAELGWTFSTELVNSLSFYLRGFTWGLK